MTENLQRQFEKVFVQLQEFGFLPLSDTSLPGVTRLVAGEVVRGSWWAHEKAHTIFAVNEMLEDHRDVLVMKLISGKVTFVHRELWPHIYAVGVAREAWQVEGLTPGAKTLLKMVDEEGTLRTDKISKPLKPGDSARELELRLLVHADQIHTEAGAHAKVLETWPAWGKRSGLRGRPKSPSVARAFLEGRLAEVNNTYHGHGRLPWD